MEASSPPVAGTPAPRGPALQEAGVEFSKLWWLWLVFGFVWIAIALVVLQFDRASITTVGVLIGAMFLASGSQQLAIAGAGLVEGWLRWVLTFFGVLLVIAGVIALANPEDTFAGVADVLGFLFLVVGAFWIIQAFGERDVNPLPGPPRSGCAIRNPQPPRRPGQNKTPAAYT